MQLQVGDRQFQPQAIANQQLAACRTSNVGTAVGLSPILTQFLVAGLDRGLDLRPRGHRQETASDLRQPLASPTDPEPHPFRDPPQISYLRDPSAKKLKTSKPNN